MDIQQYRKELSASWENEAKRAAMNGMHYLAELNSNFATRAIEGEFDPLPHQEQTIPRRI